MDKIRMINTASGPNGTHPAGAVRIVGQHVSKEDAEAFVNGGYAVDISEKKQKRGRRRVAANPPKETATTE